MRHVFHSVVGDTCVLVNTCPLQWWHYMHLSSMLPFIKQGFFSLPIHGSNFATLSHLASHEQNGPWWVPSWQRMSMGGDLAKQFRERRGI